MEIPYRHRKRYEALRRVVLAALGPKPRMLGRRRMAAFLRSLADELEERHIPRGHGGRFTKPRLLPSRYWLLVLSRMDQCL